MRAQDRFKQIVQGPLAQTLKERGFRKRDARWGRPIGENWEVVSLQRSRHSTGDEAPITVNLAVAIDRLRDNVRTWKTGQIPSESRCHIHERLGFLLPARQDVWWTIKPDTEPEAMSAAIADLIAEFGLPWLQSRSRDEGLRDMWLANLANEPGHHLFMLAKLVDQIGPAEALDAIRAELRRKDVPDPTSR